MHAHEIKAIAAQADETDELLTRYMERVGMVGEFIGALRLAACEEVTRDKDTTTRLYWPTLMEGLALMLPKDGPLEVACHKTVLALHALSEGADPRGAPPSAPGGAKRTTRAALAAVATQPQ